MVLITKIIIEIIQNIVTIKKLFKYFKLIVDNTLNWYKLIFLKFNSLNITIIYKF